MKFAVFMDNKRFIEKKFHKETDFEDLVKNNSSIFFGEKSIYLGLKRKIRSKTLGNSIPDGYLFDFNKINAPKFYLVEVELAKHDFPSHILPQITKFLSFFNNDKGRGELIEYLYSEIGNDSTLEREFRSYIGKKDLYKALKDIIDDSQKVLIIIDSEMPEFYDIFETYPDSWRKSVKIEILKQFKDGDESIFLLEPEFEEFNSEQIIKPEEDGKFSEKYFTEGLDPSIYAAYVNIRDSLIKIDPEILVNPTKNYISFRKNKNFVYILLNKKSIRIVVMLPHEMVISLIDKHTIKPLTPRTQKFWGGECTEIIIENERNINEVVKIIKIAYNKQ